MSNLVVSREVYAPGDRAFSFVADLERHPEWWPNVIECHRLDPPGPLTPGNRYATRYSMLGRQLTGLITITEVVPGQRLRYEVEGQVRAHFRWEFTRTAQTRTRVIVFVEYTPPGLVGRVYDHLFVERRNAADGEHAMEQLKEHLEGEAMARVDSGVV